MANRRASPAAAGHQPAGIASPACGGQVDAHVRPQVSFVMWLALVAVWE